MITVKVDILKLITAITRVVDHHDKLKNNLIRTKKRLFVMIFNGVIVQPALRHQRIQI